MRDLYCQEAEEGEEEVCQLVLAGFQDALSPDQWEICGCERFRRGREGMLLLSLLPCRTLTLRLKYINSKLKVKFDLNTTSKPKPVAGPDDLILLLTYH
jgi:hypothetical protein